MSALNVATHRIRCAHCNGQHSTVLRVRECGEDMVEAVAEARADFEAERGYDRMLERRAERGSWFGFGE